MKTLLIGKRHDHLNKRSGFCAIFLQKIRELYSHKLAKLSKRCVQHLKYVWREVAREPTSGKREFSIGIILECTILIGYQSLIPYELDDCLAVITFWIYFLLRVGDF